MRQGLPSRTDLVKDPHNLYEGIDYPQFWTGSQKRRLDELEQALLRALLPVSGYRIVDLGCGYGRLSGIYTDRFQQTVMVDGSVSLLRQASERTGGKATYIAADVRRLPFRPGSFDAVLMIRVFHHIEDTQECVSEFHRLLSKEGRLVFNYCNKQNAERTIRWFLRKSTDNPFTMEPDGLKSTFISHHPKAVHDTLHECGFSDRKYYGAGVLDRLAGKIDLIANQIETAKALAPFLAWSRIAPWIFCQAAAMGNQELIKSQELVDILQCPACGGALVDQKGAYRCVSCGKEYPVEDGVINFLL